MNEILIGGIIFITLIIASMFFADYMSSKDDYIDGRTWKIMGETAVKGLEELGGFKYHYKIHNLCNNKLFVAKNTNTGQVKLCCKICKVLINENKSNENN